ncbi:uncharacterized protein LOC144917778 [Branchiostoma floridae x Branchiostoma belcheri]
MVRCYHEEQADGIEHRYSYTERLLQGLSSQGKEQPTKDKETTTPANAAAKFQALDKRRATGGNTDSLLVGYAQVMVEAIVNDDSMLETEAIKSLGDVYLKSGTETGDTRNLTKATALYNRALARCHNVHGTVVIVHRLLHTAKIRQDITTIRNKRATRTQKQDKKGQKDHLSPFSAAPSSDRTTSQVTDNISYRRYLQTADRNVRNGDLDAAETNITAALKLVHDRSKPKKAKEADCLCRLGDVYVERGKRTGEGRKFTQAAGLYNASMARTDGDKQNMVTKLQETEREFLRNTCNLDCEPCPYSSTLDHKKELDNSRACAKSQLEAVHQQHNPYQYDEDDPVVREVEIKRAEAIKNLFKSITVERREFIQVLTDECIAKLGPPPCKYAFIGMGSQATELVTPYSDLEFAILIEEGKDYDHTRRYFLNLTHYLHLKVINFGETILPAMAIPSLNDFLSEDPEKDWFFDSVTPRGFAFDGFMPWASKTPFGRDETKNKPPVSLIQTPAELAEYQHLHIALAEGYHLSDILRRVTYLTGDESLVNEYTIIVNQSVDSSPILSRLSAITILEDSIREINVEPTGQLVDVKKEIYRFPSVAVDVLSIYCGMTIPSVWGMIEELHKTQRISHEDAHHLTVLISISAELRLRTYIANGGQTDRLSPLTEMKTELDKHDVDDTFVESVFHIPESKMLFRYYYTVIPLKRCILDTVQKENQTTNIFPTAIFDTSSLTRGRIAQQLLQFEASKRYFEAALKEAGGDEEQQFDILFALGNVSLSLGDFDKATNSIQFFISYQRYRHTKNVLPEWHCMLLVLAHESSSYRRYLQTADRNVRNGDLDAAETNITAALKLVHDRSKPKKAKEADCLCRLGDVYVERGKRTGEGRKFTQAAGLYNASMARTDGDKQNMVTKLQETEREFLRNTCNLDCEPCPYSSTLDHKKELDNSRACAKSQLEAVHQQHNPYQYDEDDPVVREVEIKRAEAIKNLFKSITVERREFIQVLTDECIAKLGPPPCKYAFIGMGSQATELVTPYSDLEFAILIEEGKDYDHTRRYFLNLTHYLHLKVINFGETILPAMAIPSLNDFLSEDPEKDWFFDSVTPRGFAFDGFMPWASKTPFGRDETKNKPPVSLIQTPAELAEYQHLHIALAEGYHLSDILRRVTYLTGDESLVNEYTIIVNQSVDSSPILSRLSAITILEDSIREINVEPTGQLVDVKKEIYRFPSVAVDVLSIYCGMTIPSVWGMIEELHKTQRISHEDAHHLTVLISISAELRLRTYIANGGQTDRLSPLTEMKTELDKHDVDDTFVESVFHIPESKMLFRYYYTVIPLKRCILDTVQKENQTTNIFPTAIFDTSSLTRGRIAQQLLQFEASKRYFEAALKEAGGDEEQQFDILFALGNVSLSLGDFDKATNSIQFFISYQRYRHTKNVLPEWHCMLLVLAHESSSYRRYLQTADRNVRNGDLDAAETNITAALKLVHDRSKPKKAKEADCLCRLGDVYVERGKRTGEGRKFTQAAGLYNASMARTDGDKQNMVTKLQETEREFLRNTCNLDCEPCPYSSTLDHKKELDNSRACAKSQLEAVHQQHNPYQYDEDDPVVREVEIKRAEAIKNLFKSITVERREFIQVLTDECIAKLGPPPCKYAFIGMGSQATELVTPYSDLEFAILIEEGKDYDHTRRYFLNLTHYLHLKVINFGETILPAMAIPSLNDFLSEDPEKDWFFDSVTPRGFAFDGFMPWASKTPFGRDETKNKPPVSLIQTPAELAEYQHLHIALAEGYHLSDILRRVTYLTGDESLVNEYTIIVNQSVDSSPILSRLSAITILEDSIREINVEPTGQLVDVKKEIYRFPSVAVDVLSIYCGMTIPSVWGMIEELHKTQRISHEDAHHLTVLISISAELRLRTYIANGGQTDRLSPLTEMKTELDKHDVDDTFVESVFHIPESKMLFRYYYTVIPLKRCILDTVQKENQTTNIFPTAIFDTSSLTRGRIAQQLLQFEASKRYFEAALKEAGGDEEQQFDILFALGNVSLSLGDFDKATNSIQFFISYQRYRHTKNVLPEWHWYLQQ